MQGREFISAVRSCFGRGRVAGLLLLLATGAKPAWAQENPDFKNTALPFDKRVADLVKRFTLAEKGQQVQMAVPANARLGIAGVNWWTEGLHGIARNGRATVFPQAIGMAAAWNPALMGKVGEATADEARAKFDNNNPGMGGEGGAYRGIIVWAPTINMDRDPRWGRSEETYGEDVCLTTKLAVAFCKGLQGDDPKYLKTVATPKHFAMYSQENGRHNMSFDISEKTLREYYLPAFDACIHEGKAASVMAAYNGINGIPCLANQWLLTDLLRGEWGFEGAVVTDFYAPDELMSGHRYSATMEDVCADCINAGCDVLCDPINLSSQVAAAVRDGKLKEEVLDRALARDLMLRFRLGLFDPPAMVPFTKSAPETVGSKEHMNLALQMARESIVLLKNDPAPKGFGFDKVLPLDLRRISSIAVIGPYANTLQFGNYSGSPANPAPSPLAAIRAAVGERVIVRNADYYDKDESLKAAAALSDVAVVVLGLNQQIEFEGIDRSTLDLPLDQRQFLEKVVKANPVTIVVMEGGGPIGCTWLNDHVPALLMSWYSGEQGGNALAEILLGQTNPSGKLPVTFYKSLDDVPTQNDYEISHGRTYMYLKKPPSYAFGFGLSYTTFDFSPLRLEAREIASGGTIKASLDLTNTGPRDGDEVVQLYVRRVNPVGVSPIKQLKAFQRITIPRGEKKRVDLAFAAKDLAIWNDKDRKFVVETGRYELMAGAASDDIKVRAEIEVK